MDAAADPSVGMGAAVAATTVASSVASSAASSSTTPPPPILPPAINVVKTAKVVSAIPSPVAVVGVVQPGGRPAKRAKTDGVSPAIVVSSPIQVAQSSPGITGATIVQTATVSPTLVVSAGSAGISPPQQAGIATAISDQLYPGDTMTIKPEGDGSSSGGGLTRGQPMVCGPVAPAPGTEAPMEVDNRTAKQKKADEDKQKRLYRVGLSYRCGRCGKPKKGHVCDQPEEGAEGNGAGLDSPGPAILATTVRKGTPPALLGSPLLATTSPGGNKVAVGSPLADVKVSGEATAIFKDMVAALGENGGTGLSPQGNGGNFSPGAPPPPIAGAAGISPLAQSAIADGAVSGAAATGAAPAQAPGGEPQLSEMDLMLADLAFAARPPPVMTPDEGNLGNEVGNGLGSLSPSNFSPGTMIQQLITTPNGTNGWSASQIAEMSAANGNLSARKAVLAQPSSA